MTELFKCAGPSCPGYPYRASDLAHPASCNGPTVAQLAAPIDAAFARLLEREPDERPHGDDPCAERGASEV